MSENELYYLFGGQRVSLKKVITARLVVPKKDENPLLVGARLVRSTRLSLDAAYRNHLMLRGDPDKLSEVVRYRDIARTRSVMVDPDGNELALTDRILVSFESGVSASDRQTIAHNIGAVIVDEQKDFVVLQVRDNDEDAPLFAANTLAEIDGVDYAEPDALQKAIFQQERNLPAQITDPSFANQWHLSNDGRSGGIAGADVRAMGAWEVTFGSPTIKVVVHDSGVDIDHPDLAANIDPGWDFDNDDPDASNDDGPHGTACAGVIAAPMNGAGVVGIAPGCRIVPLRAAGAHPWSVWAQTFDWASGQGDVISCSWTISPNQTLARAIRRAVREGRGGKGIACFCATGNDGNNRPAGFPANMPETTGVGASSNRDLLASYSQVAPGLDFIAPSSGGRAGTLRIETTDVVGANGYSTDDYCRADNSSGFGGTSSATPLAAGVAALMLSVNPNLTAEEIRSIMRSTARKIDPANAAYDAGGFSSTHGYGCINATEAVLEAQRMTSPAVAVVPESETQSS